MQKEFYLFINEGYGPLDQTLGFEIGTWSFKLGAEAIWVLRFVFRHMNWAHHMRLGFGFSFIHQSSLGVWTLVIY